MKMRLQRAHNMIPAHCKWCVITDHIFMPFTLVFGTRKQCESYIRDHANERELPEKLGRVIEA